jgi:hypothetical protein
LGSTVTGFGVELDSTGGNGGAGYSWGGLAAGAIGDGGGGGGGIVDIVGNSAGLASFNVDVSGGQGFAAGANGLFFTKSVPEPSGLVLAGIATISAASYGWIRRRTASRRRAPTRTEFSEQHAWDGALASPQG